MEQIWKHVIDKELHIKADEVNLLLTETAWSPIEDREEMAKIVFEKLGVNALALAYQPILSLYSTGRTSGVVMDVGHHISQAVIVHEGSVLHLYTKRIFLAGRDLDERMAAYMKKMSLKGNNDVPSWIKEKICYVAHDHMEEIGKYKSSKEHKKEFLMPDGAMIKVGIERFEISELLFQPHIADREVEGIHTLLFNAITDISKIEPTRMTDLYQNIVLVGGSSLLPGLNDRLNMELTDLALPKNSIKIISPQQPHSAAWLGGSIMCGLPTFDQKWITKNQYDEEGISIFSRENF